MNVHSNAPSCQVLPPGFPGYKPYCPYTKNPGAKWSAPDLAKAISGNIAFTYPQNTKNHVQINVQQWYQDYPAASDFLNILFGCDSFHPGSDSSINIAGFCNKPINAQMHRALDLALANEDAANLLWGKIDKQVTDQAPMATMFTPKHLDFVSKRVGNFVFSKQFYWLVDQSWVQ